MVELFAVKLGTFARFCFPFIADIEKTNKAEILALLFSNSAVGSPNDTSIAL